MTVGDVGLINLTCEASTAALMCVLIAGVPYVTHSRKRTLLMAAMWLHLATVVAASGAVLVHAQSVAPPFVLGCALHMLADLMEVLTCLATMAYVYTDTDGTFLRDRVTDVVFAVIAFLNVCNLALVLTNPWTGLLCFFTQRLRFVWGPAAGVPDLINLVSALSMAPVVVRHRARYGRKATVRLLVCGTLITVGVLCNLIDPGLRLLHPAIGLSFTLLCVGVQARLEEDLAQARAESAESRVRLLSGQIRPHFIFNALAVIKALVSIDPERAELAIQDFSDFLRSHLEVMSAAGLVPFSQEMDHVRHYVSLEQTDGTTPLDVRYDIEVDDFLVPPLTVQPLVENAIRHGIKTREQGGSVIVSTRREADGVRIVVRDDGCGFSSVTERQSQRRRVGIENVRERLERQCSGTLEVRSGMQGTTATVTIPEGDGHEVLDRR